MIKSNRKPPAGDQGADDARERILGTAYELFCRHGIYPVGVDRITTEAGVAKMTLYRNFRSKNELAVAVLERRHELWTHGWLEPEARRRGDTGAARLLGIFDALDEWFCRDDFEGCLFVNSLLEHRDGDTPIARASAAGLERVRAVIRALAEEASVPDPDAVSHRLQGLMIGAIVAASAGDAAAAQRARGAAALIIARDGAPREAGGAT